ncbi:MAG: DEAD/DEAH box helicase [bacterium]
MTFQELQIEEKILRAIAELGFEEATPVQEKVIPILLQQEPKDIIALAQTGTGKTAAFGLPIIQKAKASFKKVQYLILSPTRELCLQIADDFMDYAKYKPEIKIVPVFGGSSIERQIQLIKKGVQIISATPGRLLDLINRGVVDLSHVNTVVLDEADEMLNMGFRDDLEAILETVPKQRTTLLFSATMPNEVLYIAKNHMTDPVEITIGKKNVGAENVDHVCYLVHAKDRYLALKRIVDYYPGIYGIIFCRTRKETQEVADLLMKDGYNADSLHGDLSQAQRDAVMNKFRIKHLKLLIATDVAARGLDVESLSHIINYNLPEELDIYTHRSGRTGRAGRKGTSILIANMKEKHKIQMIERIINKKFSFKQVPLGKDICEKQLFNLIDRMEKVEVDYTQIDPYLPDIIKKLEWIDRDELIKKFVSVEFNRFLEYYKNAPDLNAPVEFGKPSRDKKQSEMFTRFFINLGKTDNLKPGLLMNLIDEYTGFPDIEIGQIEILTNFSFFEADTHFKDVLMEAFNGQSFKKRKIALEVAESKGRGGGRGEWRKPERKREGNFSQDKKKFRAKKDFGRSEPKKEYGKSESRRDFRGSESKKEFGRSESKREFRESDSKKEFGRSESRKDFSRSESKRDSGRPSFAGKKKRAR